MKAATATVVLAMFGVAAAQKFADALPECAVKCLEDGVSKATDCDLDDSMCICGVDNYRNTYTAAQACVLQACGANKSLDEVLPAAVAFCSDVTGGLTAPPVDENSSAAATGTAGNSQATSPSNADASQTTGSGAAPTGTDAEASPAATTTEAPNGAGSLGSIGGIGMLALGVLAL